MCNAGREAWHRVDPQSTAVKPRSHWKYGWHRLGVSTAQIQGGRPRYHSTRPQPRCPCFLSSPRLLSPLDRTPAGSAATAGTAGVRVGSAASQAGAAWDSGDRTPAPAEEPGERPPGDTRVPGLQVASRAPLRRLGARDQPLVTLPSPWARAASVTRRANHVAGAQ